MFHAFRTRRGRAISRLLPLWLLASTVLTAGCDDDDGASPGQDLYGLDGDRWEVEIRRTEDGVPHVRASTLSSALFGIGYAFAEDHACTLLEMIHKVRGESAAHFGPGPDGLHVDQDFAMRQLDLIRAAEESLPTQRPEVQAALLGYAAGFNHRITSDPETLPSLCRGADWVRPLTPVDLLAYYRFLALTGSARQMLDYMGNATPPPPPGAMHSVDRTPRGHISDLATPPLSSNGYALGRDLTSNGAGMVLGNPHFPWQGELRLWEMHIQVPGLLNVYGASLLGVPAVLIGFNEDIAWTHTFSMVPRFTLYRLRLDPDDPTRYAWGDDWREMEARTFTVEVLQEDGTLETVERTLYRSHYGPILNIDPLGWTRAQALTFRDANVDNDRIVEQFLGMNLSSNLDDFAALHLETARGIPWVHTMAASRDGEVFYADAGAIPWVDDSRIEAWEARLNRGDPMTNLIWNLAGLRLLDGSDPDDTWREDETAVSPGLVPHHMAPTLRRTDYVMNANDPARVPHHEAFIENVPRIYDIDPAPLGMRSRASLSLLSDPPTADGRLDAATLRALVFENPGFASQLWREAIVAQCDETPIITWGEDESADLSEACAVLSAWDGRYLPESRGAVLFRELLFSRWMSADLYRLGRLTTTPFDPAQPMTTPSGLVGASETGPPPGLRALAHAKQRLEELGWPLDVALGEAQFVIRRGEPHPMGGARDYEGGIHSMWYGVEALSRIDAEPVIGGGYPLTYGSSFLMTVTWEEGRPAAHTILAYGQSGDPENPLFQQQIRRLREGDWRAVRFTEADILASDALSTTAISIER